MSNGGRIAFQAEGTANVRPQCEDGWRTARGQCSRLVSKVERCKWVTMACERSHSAWGGGPEWKEVLAELLWILGRE